MKKAFALTAYNRPQYLAPVLESLSKVRGWEDWHIMFSIDNSEKLPEVLGTIQGWLPFFEERTTVEVSVNPDKFGVLHHPWVVFDRLFVRDEYEFVVRAEDDLLVSDDILEFFSYAAEEYKDDSTVATVNSFSYLEENDPSGVLRLPSFNPLNWGTWYDRWTEILGPTWDHDYSTYNGYPGNQSGWDWNINTRLFPQRDLFSVAPVMSRTNNIGLVGTHSTPENFFALSNFTTSHPGHGFELRVDTTRYDHFSTRRRTG